MTDSAAWPDDCLLRACAFTEAGTCTVHGDVCPDCPCGTPLHWEPATAACVRCMSRTCDHTRAERVAFAMDATAEQYADALARLADE